MPHNMPRVYPTPGQGSAERGEAGGDRDGGTSRTPSPTGRLRVGRGCINGYAQASVTQKPVGVGVPDDPLFRRPRGKNKQYNEKSRLLGRGPTPAPTYDDRQRTGVAYFFAPRIQIKNAAPAGRFHSSRRADTLAAEWVLRASGRGGRGHTRSCVGATPRRVTPSQTPARRLCACDSAYLGRYAAISMTGITSAAAVLMREASVLATGSSVIISSAAPLRSRTRAA